MATEPRHRLPPNQQLIRGDRWPVVGERVPRLLDAAWRLRITGCVRQEVEYTLDQLASLGLVEQLVDIHCVTRWSRLDVSFGGVPLRSVLTDEIVGSEAQFVSFVARSQRHHSSSLPLPFALEHSLLLALEANGLPLSVEHGGPLRLVVPDKYFYKSVKWLERIELLPTDRLGYWEADAGYHNEADPWREQRYVATSIDKQEAARLMAQRDVAGQVLLGFSAADRELSHLRAQGAILRNADFCRSRLVGADFRGANLSNARFFGADLRNAQFLDADLEGADFSAADLRGADLRARSLFGASFGRVGPDGKMKLESLIDPSTRWRDELLDGLTLEQRRFLRRVRD